MSTQARASSIPIEKKRSLWKEIRKNRWAYVFISPFYILFLAFGLGPFLFSIYMSFSKWDGLGPIEFVGLKNFQFLFGPGAEI